MGGVDELVELLAPEVELCLGRTKWGVRWSHAVLLRLERETGKSVLKGEVSPFKADSRMLRAMVKVTCPWGVRWDRLTPRMAGKLLEGFGEAWLAAMPIPSPKRLPKSTDGSVGGGVEPDSWLEAWANAHQCLRLSGAEWLAFTPRMIQVLSEFRLEELRRQEWMSAQIAANVVNFGGMGTPTPAHARDFMLHPWPEMGTADQTIEDVIWSCVQSGSLDPASKSSMMKLMMEPVPPGVN